MKQGSSNRKVNEQAREVIANALLFDMNDPRLSMVTITGCEVSYDRSVCNVYYTANADSYETVADAFEKATGRIRSVMAKELSWRQAPELRFMLDASVDEAARIEAALAREALRTTSDTDDKDSNGIADSGYDRENLEIDVDDEDEDEDEDED